MKTFQTATLITLLLTHLALAEVPDVVVEQCMAANDASKLPDCLKEGAFGYQMLETATSDDFYGDAAKPVSEYCVANNKSYQSAWTCFTVAAEAAAETRNLIGIEKITDICVAAISDAAVYQRLSAAAKNERRAQFPDELFSGGNLYHGFKGCK